MSPSRLKLIERADPDSLPNFRLTDRDREIISAVYLHRVLTTPQIEALFFPVDPQKTLAYISKRKQKDPNREIQRPGVGATNRCNARLKMLFHHGYLWRDEVPTKRSDGRKPLVYFLDKKGVAIVCDELGLFPDELGWEPRHNTVSDPFIDHLILTNDVRVSFAVACRQSGNYELAKWIDDQALKSDHMKDTVTISYTHPKTEKKMSRKTTVIPDGYFILERNNPGFRWSQFLEVDKATVVGQYSKWGRRDWQHKIQAYLTYYGDKGNGGYFQRYQTTSLRVLTVTTSPQRLENLKKITQEAGGKGRFWFTTFDQLSSETVLTGKIWQKAGAANQDHLFSLAD